ncbi:DUF2460 domain-containing protein [Nitratiruptor sp. SB155-2]|uniref:DUF2460 domain-containing protein n=1 Tax=Nitratiruptor sp. (strain SB155-2) TaxID=387092 RepID=UPI0001586F5C|nr:DUF2460 domain-containing protein [Nitratiruptor sp. SB155-2]BAF69591.1 hypothetical protein NIS_0477 [Nitratiruptor sp. SB155-2]BAN05353.1 hypothetical protein [Nitratiruptor phage NrS-1]
MRYVQPRTTTLSVTDNGYTYTKTVYEAPTTISGVTDETYPNYDPGATYNLGEYVIVPELKTIYRCTDSNVTGVFPPSDQSKWIDWGFVNSYKMLSTDEQIGAQTVGTNIVLEMPFSRCDTVGLVNIHFAQLLLELIDNDKNPITGESVGTGDGAATTFQLANTNIVKDSETIYVDSVAQTRDTDYTIDNASGQITFTTAPADGAAITADYQFADEVRVVSGRDIGCISFSEYFYDEIKEKSRVIATDIKWLPNATLRLTFDGGTEGVVKIGSIVIGSARELGLTLYGTELSFEDKSKIQNDEFTNTRKVIRYGHVRVLKAKVVFDVPDFNVVAQKVGEIVGKNVLFIPDETDRFSEMTNIAYIEDFSMPIDNPVKFETTTTIVGVA